MKLVLVVMVLAACGTTATERVCPGAPVDFAWPAATCDRVDCRGTTCDITCDSGTTCPVLDCSGSPQCRLDCQAMSLCEESDCRDTESCFIDCHGEGSTCEVDGEGSTGTLLHCHDDGAACLLRCGSTSAPGCAMQCDLPGALVACGGGTFACNRPCS